VARVHQIKIGFLHRRAVGVQTSLPIVFGWGVEGKDYEQINLLPYWTIPGREGRSHTAGLAGSLGFLLGARARPGPAGVKGGREGQARRSIPTALIFERGAGGQIGSLLCGSSQQGASTIFRQ